jgi:large subunit ribosomal protein L24
MRIHKGDTIKVLAGKDRGKRGKVLQVLTSTGRVVVEGVNQLKKNVRPRREGEKGQIVEFNAPLHASNVQLVCPKCSKPTRIGYVRETGGKKLRCCRHCQEKF